MNVKKIIINKDDEATLVAEKIIDLEAREIILSVPRFSRLAETVSNFRLLKREAEALKKKLIIESVDNKVIEFCKSTGIECINPFFNEGQRHFSDIVPDKKEKHHLNTDIPKAVHHKRVEDDDSDFNSEVPQEVRTQRRVIRVKKGFLRKFVFYGGALAILALVFYAIKALPKADIKITTAKADWSYDKGFLVDAGISSLDISGSKIPGQVFSQTKNLQMFFPASGKKQVQSRAAGKILVYNAHSSSPQSLVQNTRFQTSDGKIFRLADKITVPGAKIIDGKIEPSSIEARVLSDKPGEDYNIGPVAKFTIPGFSGTPKFNSFYAESKEAMQGGFVGEAAFPTKDDLEKSRIIIAESLEQAMKALTLAQLPDGFKFLQNAEQFKLVKETINSDPSPENKFSILLEAKLSFIAFKEEDLLNMLYEKAKSDLSPEFEVKSYKLDYGDARFYPDKSQLAVSIDYNGVLAKKIDIKDLKSRIAGKSETDLKALIFSVAGLESAQISLWPFWTRRVPENYGKITVVVD